MITQNELALRHGRCRELVKLHLPDACGILIFSRINIYYLSGTVTNGVLWLPATGNPVLFCRKGAERARNESPVADILEFRNFADISPALDSHGHRLSKKIAVEMNGISWALSRSLRKHLHGHEFVSADRVLSMTRAVKTRFELEKMRKAGAAHARCLERLLPEKISAGMNEFEISSAILRIFMSEGHIGPLRMSGLGEDIFLGHTSVGDNANMPGMFNGPVGLKGVHPSAPCMGSRETVWNEKEILTVDNGFNVDGYQTDKTMIYWSGRRRDIPDKAAAAHDFCLEIQQRLAERLKPGAIPEEIWNECMERVSKSRWKEGFMGVGPNRVGFVGHGIGLAIDEWPVIASGFREPLEAGMTIALEPKIGIPGTGMVGIENTFEITDRGAESITGNAFDITCVASCAA